MFARQHVFSVLFVRCKFAWEHFWLLSDFKCKFFLFSLFLMMCNFYFELYIGSHVHNKKNPNVHILISVRWLSNWWRNTCWKACKMGLHTSQEGLRCSMFCVTVMLEDLPMIRLRYFGWGKELLIQYFTIQCGSHLLLLAKKQPQSIMFPPACLM